MTIKKTLMIGLFAAVGSSCLQAESLTLTFNLASGGTNKVSFAGGLGAAFSGSIGIQSVTAPGLSSTCNQPCSLSFQTLPLSDFLISTTAGIGSTTNSEYQYEFNGTNTGVNNFSAQTGPGGSLFAPNTSSPLIGSSDTFTNGTVGSTGGLDLDGTFHSGSPSFTNLTLSVPISAAFSANLSTILAAFGLTGSYPLNGTLSFGIQVSSHPDGTGKFTNAVVLPGGTLTLDVASIIPEPSSVLLMGLGLVCVAFIGRKRLLAANRQ